MSVSISALLDAARSHAMKIGRAERVLAHEPWAHPGQGLTIGVWPDQIRPVRSSGLSSVSVLVVLRIRLYGSLTAQPVDELDVEMINAVDALLASYVGNFTLGLSGVRNVDIFGAEGVYLRTQSGYLEMPDGTCRVVDIDLPLILNNVWEQVP